MFTSIQVINKGALTSRPLINRIFTKNKYLYTYYKYYWGRLNYFIFLLPEPIYVLLLEKHGDHKALINYGCVRSHVTSHPPFDMLTLNNINNVVLYVFTFLMDEFT